MKFNLGRTRLGAAVMIAFTGGLLMAGAFNLTPFSQAQSARIGSATPVIPEARNLADFSNSFVAVAEAVTPAVVSIRAESRPVARPPRTQQQQQQAPRQLPPGIPPGLEEYFRGLPEQQESPIATGTGFVVTEDGYILTNNHVVTRRDRYTRQEKVTVTMNDGRIFDAKIVGNDPETDVAVLKIESNRLPVAAMGDDNATRIGEWVLAIGNPLGLDFTVTAGIVSAKGRRDGPGDSSKYRIMDFIQTDAAINPGNSGGPLINIRGEVIGINSAIASETGYYQGYGFAIPITLAHDIMNNLIANGRIRASILGVSIREVTPETAERVGLKSISGVLVSALADPNSPAAKAGIEMGDVIVDVNGRPTARVGTLQRTIRSFPPGTTVDVKVMRWGQPRTIKVRLEERPGSAAQVAAAPAAPDAPAAAFTFDKLGINVEVVTPEWFTQNRVTVEGTVEGLRVTEVSPSRRSSAQLGGSIITHVVTASGKTAIKTEADLRAALAKVRDGGIITFQVRGFENPQGRGATLTPPNIVDVRVGAQ